MSRPASPAETVRGALTAAVSVARESFLAGALHRLALTSPVPAPAGKPPNNLSELPPCAGSCDGGDPPHKHSRDQERKEAKRRRRERKAQEQQHAVQVPVVDDLPDSLETLSTSDLRYNPVDRSEDANNAFGTDVTVSLLSREDALSYANSVVLASLSSESDAMPF